jgi:hypothetical protein
MASFHFPSAAYIPRNTTLPVCEFVRTPPSESQLMASARHGQEAGHGKVLLGRTSTNPRLGGELRRCRFEGHVRELTSASPSSAVSRPWRGFRQKNAMRVRKYAVPIVPRYGEQRDSSLVGSPDRERRRCGSRNHDRRSDHRRFLHHLDRNTARQQHNSI